MRGASIPVYLHYLVCVIGVSNSKLSPFFKNDTTFFLALSRKNFHIETFPKGRNREGVIS
jgi:hypothetical protein